MSDETDQVSMWINNDGDFYPMALDMAERGAIVELEEFCIGLLKTQPEHSAAWYVRRYLSDYDLERVDWAEVASDLASK